MIDNTQKLKIQLAVAIVNNKGKCPKKQEILARAFSGIVISNNICTACPIPQHCEIFGITNSEYHFIANTGNIFAEYSLKSKREAAANYLQNIVSNEDIMESML